MSAKTATTKATTKKAEVAEASDVERQISGELLNEIQAVSLDLEFEEVKELAQIPAMMVGKAPLDKAGFSFTALLKGHRRIFSDEFKKTGKKLNYNGKTSMYRDMIIFEKIDAQGNATGEEFGIWATGFLSNELGKYPRNTIVKVTYEGKEMRSNTSVGDAESHVFKFQVPKGTLINKYQKGILNWLSNPLPSSGEKNVDKGLVDAENYARDLAAGIIDYNGNVINAKAITPSEVLRQ